MAKAKSGRKAQTDSTMVVEAYGGATAIGTDTGATATVQMEVRDKGQATVTTGKVIATASATSDTGGDYATVLTGVDISGADKVKIRTKTVSGDGDGWAFETSITTFRAKDIEGVEGGRGKDSKETKSSKTVDSPPVQAEGNLALLDVDAVAVGDNTLVEVNSSVLALEGFSDVVVTVVSAADTPSYGYLLL